MPAQSLPPRRSGVGIRKPYSFTLDSRFRGNDIAFVYQSTSHRRNIRHDSRGFTFLELIISLTIFSLVALMVYATLNLGAGAADRGELRSSENQRARAVIALLSRQIKSAYPLSLQDGKGTFLYFFGESNQLSFVSGAGRPEFGGLEKVSYYLREHQGRRSLWVYTSAPTLTTDLLNDREGPLSQETELLPDVESLTWEYLSQEQDREEWSTEWNGREENKLPLAVRLSWKAQFAELLSEGTIEIPVPVRFPPPDRLGAPQGGRVSRRRRGFGTGQER
jgi:type II secretion system protein J